MAESRVFLVHSRRGRKTGSQLDILRSTILLDPVWYRESNSDLRGKPIDAAQHYLDHGALEGRNPHPLFDTNWYLSHSPGDDINPLVHYLQRKTFAGSHPHPLFHVDFYLWQLPDIASLQIDPLTHYLTIGWKQGIWPNPLFDSEWYLNQYSEVARHGFNPLVHYICQGEKEGKWPNRYFDTKWYSQKYNSFMDSDSPLTDYLLHAFSCDRQPNEAFDGVWYMKMYEDVRSSGMMPLQHFLWYGAQEHRDPGPTFETRYYLRTYPDVAYFGTDPLVHYLKFAKSEGRFGHDPYPQWVEKYGKCTNADRNSMRARIEAFETKPIISVLCPVYNANLEFLERAVMSVVDQIYPHWELCLSDDASTDRGVLDLLKAYVASDSRIKLYERSLNGHIAANTNSALSLATGDFVAFLDSDDELTEDALFWIANEINAVKDVEIIFSDEDKIDALDNRFDAYFKSDWNPALMLSQNAVCHLDAIRRGLIDRAGWLREEFNGSQDHELVLRCSRAVAEHQIRHIPRILYHWRATPTSTASIAGGKPYAWDSGRKAILEHLQHNGISAEVEKSSTGHYTVCYALPEDEPLISILMPSACKLEVTGPCLTKLLELTTYRNFEIIMMVSDIRCSVKEQAAFLNQIAKNPKVRVNIYPDRPYNFSLLNNEAFKKARGEYIVFMNDDIEIVTVEWIQGLLARMRLDSVGMVGPLLRYPSGHMQHAGVVLGIGGVADHPYRFIPRGDGGYFGRALLEQDVSCVTAACAIMKASLFADIGGFDEALLVAFNDVDLSVRVREQGERIIWTPQVEMIHHESASLGAHNSPERREQFDREVAYIKSKWGKVLDEDPFYNPNLSSISGCAFHLAFPPRLKRASELWPLRRAVAAECA
jgi:GT2 family glycosyltransferase